MQQRVLDILEFNKIKEQLVEHVSSPLGEEKVERLVPSPDFQTVSRWQEETDEAAAALRLKGHVPLDGIFDIRPHIKRASIGGMLSPFELTEIASTIHASRMMRKFIEGLTEEYDKFPILNECSGRIVVLAELEEAIRQAVDEHGEVLDSASETLRLLRSQIRAKEARIREKLENIIRSPGAQKMLSDTVITIRNERYVIPVKQEYKGYYGGIIHDHSASGQTLFIEPQSVVQLNNDLQEIRVKEQQEVERILVSLSALVAGCSEELAEITAVLGDLDFMFAKARYGRTIKGTKPGLNAEGKIVLLKARHPLIPADKVVANDIFLGDDYTAMVITGPNTGGKTVTLKTVGLLTLMAQAGLPIPASEGSEVGVFSSVFADIGDEQSIEQSLSTFSSHMVNIVDILNQADSGSLVLFDELGAGTDPAEGAALAIAILDEVCRRGARVIATTHYPELKAYGYNREGVINASVEFDIDTLRPTYKLLIGIPGRSNAFEISKRLGLQENVIEAARTHLSADSSRVESMIGALEKSRKEAEEDRKQARALLKEAEKLHKDLQKQMIAYYEQKDALMEKAREEARAIVEKAKQEAEEVIRDLRKLQMEKGAFIKEHEFIEAKRRLAEAAPHAGTEKRAGTVRKGKHVFKPGDEVKVLTFGQRGQLLEKVSEKEWLVQIGMMKMKVAENDLEFVKSEQKTETAPLATIKGKNFHVGIELDLRGERYEDAIIRLEKYIDDALLAGHPRVSIIHGKGTGALRKGVQDYLKKHRAVKKIRFGDATEGGTGVTIVEFK